MRCALVRADYQDAALGKLIYSLNVSLDGYLETPDHSLDWALSAVSSLEPAQMAERTVQAWN